MIQRWRYLWQYSAGDRLFRGFTADGKPIYRVITRKPRDNDDERVTCSVELDNGSTFTLPRSYRMDTHPVRDQGIGVDWIFEFARTGEHPQPHELAVNDIIFPNDFDTDLFAERGDEDWARNATELSGVSQVRSVTFKGGVFWVKNQEGRVLGYGPGHPI